MSNETLPAYAALKEACEQVGLQVVGTTCDGGVIVAADLETTKRAVEVFGGRRVPLQPGLTIVYGPRS